MNIYITNYTKQIKFYSWMKWEIKNMAFFSGKRRKTMHCSYNKNITPRKNYDMSKLKEYSQIF